MEPWTSCGSCWRLLVSRIHSCTEVMILEEGTLWTCSVQVGGVWPSVLVMGALVYASGAPLWEILAAGEWSSPAFLKYLDLHRLDTELVVQAHACESDSDDE